MFQNDSMPQTEPLINVGIILPEDERNYLEIHIQNKKDYFLISENQKRYTIHNSKLSFYGQSNIIRCILNDSEIIDESFTLQYEGDENTRIPERNLLVKNVPAGRGFHWKKEINVTLAGNLTIRSYNKHLILINTIPLEQYIMCVATSEMSELCPMAFLEAQTIAARSWLLANVEKKHSHLGMDVCNDDCCQRYQGTTFINHHAIESAQNTRGKVLVYDNKICDARYSKSCGGVTESFNALWEGPEHPYLTVIPDIIPNNKVDVPDLTNENNFKTWINSVPETFCSPHFVDPAVLRQYLGNVDQAGNYFRWQISVAHDELVKHINRIHRKDIVNIIKMEVGNRAASGRINNLRIIYTNNKLKKETLMLSNEYSIRQTLHPDFLYSSAILIKPHFEFTDHPAFFIYQGGGWGHGAGMCQIGALGMALNGYDSELILKHYYPGTQLKKLF
ncbi:MAG: SpoIID/LytB domain-containing protein [Calditrichaceae bacterium]|nr:SpoIID/LytB domain-containing protein [Calditrichaceae bacterium]RQV92701.1 MAG: SpoIID/LytB domain-containing protein [Calditrichota bacterium]